MHPTGSKPSDRLWHEYGPKSASGGDALSDELDDHETIGSGHWIGVLKRQLVDVRFDLVVRLLDGDPHFEETGNDLLAHGLFRIIRDEGKVARFAGNLTATCWYLLLWEQEELGLNAHKNASPCLATPCKKRFKM